jgi:hypothetical protein
VFTIDRRQSITQELLGVAPYGGNRRWLSSPLQRGGGIAVCNEVGIEVIQFLTSREWSP